LSFLQNRGSVAEDGGWETMVDRLAKPYQMLIADDDPGFRESLRVVLEPYFRLVEAASGVEAVEIIEKRRVDIGLFDMHMDPLTGLDALKALKSVNALAPGILLTGDATDELRQTARLADAFRVLSKPVTKSDLVTAVSSALENAYKDPHAFC
jgi:CheY-like chemotaxis protein